MFKRIHVFPAVLLSVACLGLFVCGMAQSANGLSITAVDLKRMIDMGEQLTVIDVRTPEEYIAGHIPGSVSIHKIPDLKEFHYEGAVVLYCTSGVRSREAKHLFAENGIKTIDLEDGINGWIATGGNVVAGAYKEFTVFPEVYEIPRGVCDPKEPAMKMGQ